jgi:uncharacterized protein (DUF983 family)
LRGLCPRCGKGHLFSGFLSLRQSCEVCGLDYSFADPADGPAFFVICFGCVPTVLLALWLDVAQNASVLTQVSITGPFLLLTCIPPLRPLKGWLVASQYFYNAEEGRIEEVERLPRETQVRKLETKMIPKIDENASEPFATARNVEAEEQDDYLDEALQETFPASDPISPGHVHTKRPEPK